MFVQSYVILINFAIQSLNAMTDEYYMKLAIGEALEALEKGEVPIGAIIVAGERIIGRGHNLVEALHDVTAHAEMQAITAASETLGGKYLTDCTIYVTVEPCSMCAAALGWTQIGRIVFGADDDKRGFRRVYGSERGPLHPRTSITGGVLAEECSTLISDFFKSLR